MIAVVDDIATCESLWRRMVRPTGLFDLWEVRACFHTHYRYRPCFLVAGGASDPTGLLALSEIDDHGQWGCFPGETYRGKTWLEQNRIVAGGADDLRALLDHCPRPAHLRYLTAPAAADRRQSGVDEIGYLFRPGDYGGSFDAYFGSFSGKSRKKLRREIDALEPLGLRFRHDEPGDAVRAMEMNLDCFGDRSYFADRRFFDSFLSLLRLLEATGRLRVTALLAGDRPVAIDFGAVVGGTYTVLAGGADPNHPGVAKVINFHHMQWACREGLETVDFLCGDFGWKERFHLTARPLFQVQAHDAVPAHIRSRSSQALSPVA